MDKQTPCTSEAEAKMPASKENIDELQSDETFVKQIGIMTANIPEEDYSESVCSKSKTSSCNSIDSNDSNSDRDPVLNQTLRDIDLFSLSKVCQLKSTPKSSTSSSHRKNSSLKELEIKMKENNQTLTSPIQKIEGRLCELSLSTNDQKVDKCMCLIEDPNTRIACLEKSTSEIQTNREENLLQKIHILEDAILQKEVLSKNLKSELDHKAKEVELLPNANVRLSEDLEAKCTDLKKSQIYLTTKQKRLNWYIMKTLNLQKI